MREQAIEIKTAPDALDDEGRPTWEWRDYHHSHAEHVFGKDESYEDINRRLQTADRDNKRQTEIHETLDAMPYKLANLRNFFYGHRTYMAMGPDFLKSPAAVRLLRAVVKNAPTDKAPYSGWDVDAILAMPPEKQMARLESDPLLSAWVTTSFG